MAASLCASQKFYQLMQRIKYCRTPNKVTNIYRNDEFIPDYCYLNIVTKLLHAINKKHFLNSHAATGDSIK